MKKAYLKQQFKSYLLILCIFLIPVLIIGADDYVTSTQSGKINWGKGYLEAKGYGSPPKGFDEAQAKLMAKRAAKSDAQRNLLETLNGIVISSQTTVKDFITKSDEIRSAMDGVLQGAIVVDEKISPDGSAEVTMRVPVWGYLDGKKSGKAAASNFSEVFLEEIVKLQKESTQATIKVDTSKTEKVIKETIEEKKVEIKLEENVNKISKSLSEIKISPQKEEKPVEKEKQVQKPSTEPTPAEKKVTKVWKPEPGKDSISDLSTPPSKPETEKGKEEKKIQTPAPITKTETEKEKKEVASVTKKEPSVKPEEPKSVTKPEPVKGAQITGIVIDASGKEATPTMAPKILSENDEEVYGPATVDREKAITEGMCSYVTSPKAAQKHKKVFDNPKYIKCIGVKNKINLVISNDDASQLRDNPELKNLLTSLKVVVVLK